MSVHPQAQAREPQEPAEFSMTYTRLPGILFEPARPTPVRGPGLLLWNDDLARELGLTDPVYSDPQALAAFFSGNQPLPGPEPIALAYAGHQFGNFVPRLGDGRAHLLGEIVDRQGRRRDVQLKGSGPTRYSRGGDGRCALGPAIREFIMSEAMHALRVPTTRSLAVVRTGEPVFREMPLPGAVVTRVAASHIRVGTFEFLAAQGQRDALASLCDYAIERHYPEILEQRESRHEAFLDRVIERQVHLVVEWMRVGFIHGVMNTDNTAISGETIDFGPCAMMGIYDPDTVYSSIDQHGRYAFGNQPAIARWNMARLATSLVPLVHEDEREAVRRLEPHIESMRARFEVAWLDMMRRKLGLRSPPQNDGDGDGDGDAALVAAFLEGLRAHQLDYTTSFHALGHVLAGEREPGALRETFGAWFDAWFERWTARREAGQGSTEESLALMRKNNPAVIPRNHHVENVLEQCADTGDGQAAEAFLAVLRAPYEEGPETARFQDPPADGDRDYRTFCGT